MKYLLILLLSILILGSANSQNKSEFERTGIKIKFQTTKLYEITGNQTNLIKDMKLSGVLIFIPDKKSIVIRHDNGNDELLKVISKKTTNEGNYVLQCNKERTLIVSITEQLVNYSVVGNSSFFMFPIQKNEITKLQNVIRKF